MDMKAPQEGRLPTVRGAGRLPHPGEGVAGVIPSSSGVEIDGPPIVAAVPVVAIGLGGCAGGVPATPDVAPTRTPDTIKSTTAPLATATPRPTATRPSGEPTAAPTNTPVAAAPTETAVPPTVTPEPTATPTFEEWVQTSQLDEELKSSVETPYIQAMNINEVDIQLQPELINGVNGQFAVLVDQTTGTPLFMSQTTSEGQWEWVAASPGNLATARGKLLGVFVENNDLRNANQVNENFNLIEPGVFFMDWVLRNGKGIYDFTLSDRWIKATKTAGVEVMSQPLIYTYGLPQWLTDGSYSPKQIQQIMQDYIRNAMTHHGNDIKYWMITNEAIWEYQGTVGYTDNLWYRNMGKQYIEIAYRTARETNPDAILIYNDYTNINPGKDSRIDGPKANAVFNLVRSLKDKGLVDAVGIQAHFFDGGNIPTKDQIRAQIERYNNIGVKVIFTEVDINIRPLLHSGMSREDALKQQAEGFRILTEACMEAGDGCIGISIYGLNDESSWVQTTQRGSSPVIMANGQPKPAYYSIMTGLIEE